MADAEATWGAPPPRECSICFDAVECPVLLPCQCEAAYCARCWDSALAASYQACSRARCPTCRAPVRARFDAEGGQLRFSLDDGEEQQPGGVLAGAADQVRRLREYAAASLPLPLLREMASFAGGAAVAARLAAVSALEQRAGGPQCVCGELLERVSARERAQRWCSMCRPDVLPGSEAFERLLESVERSGASFCDVCGEKVEPGFDHWTCRNGNKTIIHTNAYDVCDGCFVRYCSGALLPSPAEQAEPAAEPPGRPTPS